MRSSFRNVVIAAVAEHSFRSSRALAFRIIGMLLVLGWAMISDAAVRASQAQAITGARAQDIIQDRNICWTQEFHSSRRSSSPPSPTGQPGWYLAYETTFDIHYASNPRVRYGPSGEPIAYVDDKFYELDRWVGHPCPKTAASEGAGPSAPSVEVSVVGGWNSLTGTGKDLTSVDTKAADPIQTRGLSSSSSTGVVGGTVTARITDLFSGVPTNAPLIFETGVLARTGGDRTDNVAFETFAGGNGTAHDPPKWTIPILAGLAFPIGMGPNVTAKIAGGVNINRREAGFALRETGAGPAGLPVIASDTWTSVDPALDIGLKVGVGRLGAFPVSVGVDVLMDWTRSHTLIAQSPNFASQSYTMNTGRQMDTMVLFNVSLGLTPATAAAPAQAPMYKK